MVGHHNPNCDPRPLNMRPSADRKSVTITFDGPVPPRAIRKMREFASFLLVAAAAEDWI